MNCSESFHNCRLHLYIFGYASSIICLIGIFFNFSICFVYTRKPMTSSMHTIIANLAAVDTISLLAYTPHSFQESIPSTWHPSELWQEYTNYFRHLTFMFSHITTCLTVMLGVWRYIGIIHPLKERSWCNKKTTRIVIIACYVAGVVVSLPICLVTRNQNTSHRDDFNKLSNRHIHNPSTINFRELRESNDLIFRIMFFLYGVVLKTLPSVLLTIISFKLIVALRKAGCRHEILTRHTSTLSNGANPRNTTRNRHTTQITKMLVIVLVIFMLRELPHGVGYLLTAINGSEFYYNYYHYHLSDLFHTINNLCMCTYFIVYYTMSNKFRDIFKLLLGCKASSQILYINTAASCNANMSVYCNSPTSPQSFFTDNFP